MTYFLLIIAVALVLMGGGYVITQFLSLFTSAPYVPTSSQRVQAMIEFAQLSEKNTVVDLGSGDGRLVVAAARAGALAEGWEMNPLLVFWSRRALISLHLSDRAKIFSGSYRGRDFRHVDTVFLYVLPKEMARLERWLPAALRPGTQIIVNAFPFPTWTLEERRGILYRYRVPSSTSSA